MTDTPEPNAEDDSETVAPSGKADPPSASQRRPLWAWLNRTNRIATLVLGGVAAVIVALLIFGVGVLVGAEYGDSQGHRHGAGTSEYGEGDCASGDHEGDGEESASDGDHRGAESESDQGQGDGQGQSDAPEGKAPPESTPRP